LGVLHTDPWLRRRAHLRRRWPSPGG